MSEITEAATKLIEKHGGLRAAARVLGINYAYLWRLKSGEKVNPNAKILRKLGLRRQVSYESTNGR